MDFYTIKTKTSKNGILEIYPDFRVCKSHDLMVRGKAFYAVWDDETGMWSTNEYDVQRLVDQDLVKKKAELEKSVEPGTVITIRDMASYSSRSWSEFKSYISNVSDNYTQLDDKLAFSNDKITKKDYISRKLPYPLLPGSHDAFDEILGTLYSEEERAKIHWAIGSIVAGDSKDIQKFLVFYGKGGTGKSTVMNIIQKLFEGYDTVFDAKALTSNGGAFATEQFRSNPLVAIQHDGDLSHIEDNTRLNSIVSHEKMTMNEKYKSTYSFIPKCFLFMGTNEPVKIKDAESGIIRRLIDVSPTGNKIPAKRYSILMDQIDFELSGIANYCLDVYRSMGKHYYDSYRPMQMIYRTDIFFNFIEDSYDVFKENDGVSLKNAYSMWTEYCTSAGVTYKMERQKFREELKNYFREFKAVDRIDGVQVRSYYRGFITEAFAQFNKDNIPEEKPLSLVLDKKKSLLDDILKNCKAQYARQNDDGTETPMYAWDKVTTKLRDLDTKKVHYILPPPDMNLIFIDLDLKNEKGEKDIQMNLEAASKFPPTYAEFSKGGCGVHLYYIYDGDVKRLQSLYAPNIEIKVSKGKSAIRRRLSKCNDIPIARLSSGLPLKEEGEQMINFQAVEDEKHLRAFIKKALRKEFPPGSTKCSIDYIQMKLAEVYKSGMHYDVSDMKPLIIKFAMKSTNQSTYCLKVVEGMPFHSDEPSVNLENYKDDTLIFFDCEVFPNLLLINWKPEGEGKTCARMINPSPDAVRELMERKLVGFNCRRYDNHILYARAIGFTEQQIFRLSQGIINQNRNAFFGEAWNISYTDVLDFSSKKQSLKKFEIELGFHHKELGMKWDEPVPEEKWAEVAEYCDNDVLATEAVFHYLSADWTARQGLAKLSGLTVNDTTNSHTTRIIFGLDKNPQTKFNYRNMGDVSLTDHSRDIEGLDVNGKHERLDPKYTSFDKNGRPIFPGYLFRGRDCDLDGWNRIMELAEQHLDTKEGKNRYLDLKAAKSIYRGDIVGEGGYVYAEPGIYTDVALLDIASMHPSSIIAENLFGDEYTARFNDILQARIAVKHKEYDKVRTMLDGKLASYVDDEKTAEMLADVLKIPINSVYGLTSAGFDNPCRDPRNIDNIVAKRGALFMINLKNEVQSRGYTVAHIKTDSIKIPNADQQIIDFVMAYGKLYGYNFEHEATYSRMCLVNDAVYIAKYDEHGKRNKGGKSANEWTATGAQFQQPYVFKSLFSNEDISIDDMCETKTVTTALYLDMNEALSEDDHNYVFVGKAGQFCPIKKGCGGGNLVREKDGKYNHATGSKDYRWLESETVKLLGKENDIDRGYYEGLVNAAKKSIDYYAKKPNSPFESFEAFVDGVKKPRTFITDDIPPWLPCADGKYATCFECPKFNGTNYCDMGYDLAGYLNEKENDYHV